ncbi:MAG: S-methyl-5-thioribose-1-phosphate isomerase [Thermaerobacterales bacterium]
MMIQPLAWQGDRVDILDQRLLPGREVWLPCRDERQVAAAIRGMAIRGAPAIGVAAAYGLALAALAAGGRDEPAQAVLTAVEQAAAELAATRPTAANLFWALGNVVEAVRRAAQAGDDPAAAAVAAARRIEKEDIAGNHAMGAFGAPLLDGLTGVYTHCNTGGLATAGYGTALGVIRAAREAGAGFHVYAGETRPYLQGARLTAWELQKDNIPFTLCTDMAAGYLMQQGRVGAVVTGADCIAANGDVANKIGTYTLAVLAARHGIPFYVAAPLSTIDTGLADGGRITIEERAAEEVSHFGGRPVAPADVAVVNPAFDVTPAELVTAIITERGVIKSPFTQAIKRLKDDSPAGSARSDGPARPVPAPAGPGGGRHVGS